MQQRLVVLEHRDAGGLLVLHQEAGMDGLGVRGIEGDHGVGQIESREQSLEDGDFVLPRAETLALGGG